MTYVALVWEVSAWFSSQPDHYTVFFQVCEGDRLDKLNTFYIRCPQRKLELMTNSEEEKNQWISALQTSIQEYEARKESFLRSASDVSF